MARMLPGLILMVIVLVITACGGAGRRAYVSAGCEECHGDDLAGTMTGGPPLRGTRQHWDVERLLAYFANPDSVVLGDERLRTLRARYGSGMPPIKLASPEARRALARYVLR